MLGDDRPYHSLLVSVEQAFLFPPGWVILLESRPSIELAAPKSEEGLDTICFGWKCFYNELP